MAAGRFLNRSIAHSADLADLTPLTRELFLFAIPHLDKEGRMEGEPRRMRAKALPLINAHTNETVRASLAELVSAKMAIAYTDEKGQMVVSLPSFDSAQPGSAWKNKEKESRFGPPPKNSGKIPPWLRNSGDCRKKFEEVRSPNNDSDGLSHSGNGQKIPENSAQEKRREGKRREEEARATSTAAPFTSHSPDPIGMVNELKRWPALRDLEAMGMVDATIMSCFQAGIRHCDLIAAIHDLGPKAAARAAANDAWSAAELGSKLFTYARSAMQRRKIAAVDEPTNYPTFKPEREEPRLPGAQTTESIGDLLGAITPKKANS